jgi:hypothetical protein
VKNFEQSSTRIKKRGERKRNVRTQENIKRVRDAIGRSPRRSGRRHSAILGLSNRTVHHHPYKIQVVQTFNENNYVSRRRFCEQFLALINENEDMVHNLWMSDELIFTYPDTSISKILDTGETQIFVNFIRDHCIPLK